MMNSKIPIPSKRSTQSSIPLPTKVSGTGAKKLPLNSRATFTSKKPVSVNLTLKASKKLSKVEEKDEKSIKRLPTKSQDSKKVAQLTAKPSSSKLHDTKKNINFITKSSTEKNISKQAKPAPPRQLSKNIVPRSKPITGNENLPKRYSSFKSDNDKKGFCSNKLKATSKPALQPKIVNPTKKSTKMSTTILKEKNNKNPFVHCKVEKVAVVAPTRQANLAIKSGVDDSEFTGSHFFKSLILNERQLSPGIMKLYSEDKFSSGINAKLLHPPQPHNKPFQSVEDFVEEVKRISSKYYRFNGRLVLKSPGMLKAEETVRDRAEKAKENSEKFHKGKENCSTTPCLLSKNFSCQRTIQHIVSVKENLGTNIVDEVRRLSEFRKKTSPFAGGRRWTYNAPAKPSIANMSTTEIAAEVQKLSEIRRESGAQLFKKATFLGSQYSVEKLNPHQKLIKDLETLTAKKKEKTKKKVAFLIHSPDSPNLARATAAKSEVKLSDISEGSRENGTPELDLDSCKVKTNTQSGDTGNKDEKRSLVTTPGINLATNKLSFDLSPKGFQSTTGNSSDNSQSVSSKVVFDASKDNANQYSKNFGVNDSEFKDSYFFKSLILNQRQLTPGIMKLCTEDKLSSSGINGSRRWTCNAPAKPSVANMSTTEIAAEFQKLSEIRRESGAQLFKKAPFFECRYSVEKSNPNQRDLESLTGKKKDKAGKKVAFLIHSPDSPNLARATAVKSEAKLSDISEGSSQNCTPELDFDNCKVKTIPQSGNIGNKDEETSTTPELNLATYKLNFDISPKELQSTLPSDVSKKSYQSTMNNSSDNQSLSSEVLCAISKDNAEQCSENFNANLYTVKSDFLSSKFSSLQTSDNNARDISDIDLTSLENDAYSEFSNLKSTDCLFPSACRLTVPSNYAYETENFCVNTERKIYTPHPVALHSKSNLPPSVSPLFLSRKYTTLKSCAPICTPLVLKSFVPSPEVNWNDIRLRLNFNEKPNLAMERRESQIFLGSIPTFQKMNDFLCDQECRNLLSQSSEEDIHFRNLENPIASILNYGDEMHYVPIIDSP